MESFGVVMRLRDIFDFRLEECGVFDGCTSLLNEARDSGSWVYNISSCIASFRMLARKSSVGALGVG